MDKQLKLSDFDNMISASTSIGNSLDVSSDDIVVQIEDEDGELYDISDVVFNPMTRAIHIKFNHDND
jgi:hypothetical protein